VSERRLSVADGLAVEQRLALEHKLNVVTTADWMVGRRCARLAKSRVYFVSCALDSAAGALQSPKAGVSP